MVLPAFFTDPKFDRLRGMALMLCATLSFSGMHAGIKQASLELHPFEVVFFRNFCGLLVLAPFFVRYGLRPFRTTRFKLHLGRAVLNISSMTSFFYAISITPLAQVISLSFAAPVFATVLAMLIYKEMVGPARWVAILVGFAGTIVILRPGFGEIGLGPILSICAAMTFGFAVIIIKSLGRTESSLTITAYMALLMSPLSLIPALFVWQWPDGEQLLLLLLVGAFGSAGHLCMNQAIKLAPTNVVMPMDFARLIWVALLGYFLFAEVPDIFVWIGGAMIFASGFMIAHGENRKRKEIPLPAP